MHQLISSLTELEQFACSLKESPIRIFVLKGELGAGKTTLVRAFAQSFRLEQAVSSPTFALLNVYEGEVSIHHFDLYRLNNAFEAEEWGFSELVSAADYNFIEWAERAQELIPRPYICIHLQHTDHPEHRLLSMEEVL